MTRISEKREYEKPSMKVFELRQQPQLLAGSGERSPYEPTVW